MAEDGTSRRGFAAMDKDKVKKIASKGGKARSGRSSKKGDTSSHRK